MKQFRIKCDDCGKYPQFKVPLKRAIKIMKEHVKIMKKQFGEIHNPKLVEVKEWLKIKITQSGMAFIANQN